jgi:sRNA-binding carbon storage regulator CsrA
VTVKAGVRGEGGGGLGRGKGGTTGAGSPVAASVCPVHPDCVLITRSAPLTITIHRREREEEKKRGVIEELPLRARAQGERVRHFTRNGT